MHSERVGFLIYDMRMHNLFLLELCFSSKTSGISLLPLKHNKIRVDLQDNIHVLGFKLGARRPIMLDCLTTNLGETAYVVSGTFRKTRRECYPNIIVAPMDRENAFTMENIRLFYERSLLACYRQSGQ